MKKKIFKKKFLKKSFEALAVGSGTDALVGGNANDADLFMAGSPAFNASPDAAQDTFVFIEGQGGVNTNFADYIADWTDGTDKIAYSQDGGTT